MIRTGKEKPITNSDFYIINYELLHKRFFDLSKLNIRTLVCDEVQHLRSKTTQKYAAVKKLGTPPEGVHAVKAIYKKGALQESLPIAKAVYSILFEGVPAEGLVKQLMSRPIKEEH